MRIAIGSDHRGVAARKRLSGLLERLGHEVVDCGSEGDAPVDYPDIAADVATRLAVRGANAGDAAHAGIDLAAVCGLLKDRSATLEEVAESAMMFYLVPHLHAAQLAEVIKPEVRPALAAFADLCAGLDWTREAIGLAMAGIAGIADAALEATA